MMTDLAPFEEPAKTDMRARCEIAIDQAGHEGTELETLTIPGSSYSARLRGDLQSLDGEQQRYIYYIRPRTEASLPKWIVNFGREVRRLPGVKLYVVAPDPSPGFIKSCRLAGVGLLALTEDQRFQRLVDFDEVAPADVVHEYQTRLESFRRDMEVKLELGKTAVTHKLEQVAGITSRMPPEMGQSYKDDLEREFRAWDDWGRDVSTTLDALTLTRDDIATAGVERLIERGPDISQDD